MFYLVEYALAKQSDQSTFIQVRALKALLSQTTENEFSSMLNDVIDLQESFIWHVDDRNSLILSFCIGELLYEIIIAKWLQSD